MLAIRVVLMGTSLIILQLNVIKYQILSLIHQLITIRNPIILSLIMEIPSMIMKLQLTRVMFTSLCSSLKQS